MTLSNFEWLNGHFIMLNFHYYELALGVLLTGFESIIYLFTVECRVCLHVRNQRRLGNGVADRDPQNI